MTSPYDIENERIPDYPILDIIKNRWSPRAMSGRSVSEKELKTLFEAARWAPSSGNSQPWRYIYSTHRGKGWETMFGLLTEGNKQWCEKAAALLLVCSKKTYGSGKYSKTHAFTAGASFENLALQGRDMGLIVHGMEGFDYEEARDIYKVPDDYQVLAMVAVGRPGEVKQLSEKNQKREFPKGRKKLSEIIAKEDFPWE